jgi:hypothetical protein
MRFTRRISLYGSEGDSVGAGVSVVVVPVVSVGAGSVDGGALVKW